MHAGALNRDRNDSPDWHYRKMSATALARPAAGLPPRWRLRVAIVLLVTLLLHALVIDQARRELGFELPPPQATIQAELFRMPAQIAVASQPAAAAPRPARPRAIAAPPPATTATTATTTAPSDAPPAQPVEPTPEAEIRDLQTAGPTADPLAMDLLPSAPSNAMGGATLTSPMDAVLVSFPKFGRFVSDTRYIKGLLRLGGTTTIEWRIGADRYEARSVTMTEFNGHALTLTSSGEVRPNAGVAPVRYTEKRGDRAPQATNFQWAAGMITFSGSSNEVPLQDGAQDQLSFMAQLALIAQAFPERMQPGMAIALEVAGNRSTRVYDLRVIGRETIVTPAGSIETLKLDRVVQPGTRDPRIQLWLAPSMRWLPVKTYTTLTNGDEIETLLREVVFE
jgi:hypothetical protein